MPPMPTATVHTWSALPTDRPMERLERRRVIGDRMMISRVLLHAGCDVPSHRHENEQFACVLSGRVRFGLGEPGTTGYREEVLTTGQVLQLPSNVLHSAYALEESLILDLFSPPSATTGIDRTAHG